MSAPLFTAPCHRVGCSCPTCRPDLAWFDYQHFTDAEVCANRNTPTKGDRAASCRGCLFPEAPGRRAT